MTDVVNKKGLLLAAMKKALRPLIRMLLMSGLSYKDFSEFVRDAFLEEAHNSMKLDKKEVTVSGLSLMSGIHRKDVAAYLKNPEDFTMSEKSLSSNASAAFTVFSGWISQSHLPPKLPYTKKEGLDSFTALCEKITSDVRPKAILDELLRLNLVKFEQDNVVLCKDAFVPENDFEYKLKFFSQNVYEHLQSVSTNILGLGPRKFERLALHDNLTEQDIQVLKAYVDEHGMNILRAVYAQAQAMSEYNNNNKLQANHRFSLGIFTNFAKDHHNEK